MVEPKLSYTLCLSLFVASSIMAPSLASDRTQCHDIPEKQAVLNEGKELLRTAPDKSGLLELKHNRFFPAESRMGGNRYYEGAFDFFDQSQPKVDEKMSIDRPEGLKRAAFAAEVLERYFKSEEANNLYARILNSKWFANLTAEEQADIMEGAVRTKIELGLKRDDEDFRSFRLRLIQDDENLFGKILGESPASHRRFILRNLNRTSLSSQDFALVKSLCLKASEIRMKQEWNENLATDLLIVGGLCARNNEPGEASKYLLRAEELKSESYLVAITPKTGAATNRKKRDYSNGAFTNAPELSGHYYAFETEEIKALITSSLIDSYVTNKEPDKAIELFKQKCLSQKDSDICIITPESLCSVLPVLPASELSALVVYFIQAFHADIQNSMFDSSFSKIMQILKDRGWTTESDVICDSLSSPSKPSTLFAVARWYADSKNAARLLVTVKLILVAIKYDSDQEALTSLQRIQKLLVNVSKDQPGLAEVKKETDRITAYHEDQIRRKQCLTMAKDLNETAFALEKKAQPEMASKLYKHALEIKQTNLTANDPETAVQLVDLARAEAAQQHFSEAEGYFEKALAIMRKNPMADPSDTISALESYGMMLNDWKHEAKANKVYGEAKALHSQLKASPWRHIGTGK